MNPGAYDVTVHRDCLDHVYRKVRWRILPLLFVCYVAAYLDRVNIGFAKLQMQQELTISEVEFGLAAGIFFAGYVLFEIPSNLLLVKIGMRRTVSRILMLWGSASVCMMFVRDASSLYALRFILGVFEAGFAPAMLFYVTLWYPSSRLAGVTATLLLAAPMASLLGGPLSGWIISNLDGSVGLSGWQWMFLVEGLPAVGLGMVAFFKLTDSPDQATWLTASERSLLQSDVGSHAQSQQHSFSGALRTPAVYVLAVVCLCIIAGIYTISFWLPTLLKDAGVTSVLDIGLYSAIPYAAAACTMVGLACRSDARNRHKIHVIGSMFASALSLAVAANANDGLLILLLGITLATCFLWASLSVFWAIPAEFLKGPAAAGGIALINSVGLLGGFLSPPIVGYAKTVTGVVNGGLWVIVAILIFGALLITVLGLSQDKVKRYE
jgi:sugar phosphate permease